MGCLADRSKKCGIDRRCGTSLNTKEPEEKQSCEQEGESNENYAKHAKPSWSAYKHSREDGQQPGRESKKPLSLVLHYRATRLLSLLKANSQS